MCGKDDFNVAQFRKSQDKKVRREKDLLIKWCESKAILVMNVS